MDKFNSNIYLLLGPEIGQKSEFIEKLYKNALSADSLIERHKFYPYDTQVSDIVTIIRTPSLFGVARFICLADLEFFKSVDLEILFKSFSYIASHEWIILMSNQIQIKKIHPKLENMIDKKNIHIFWEMFENRKHEWVQSFFRREGEGMQILPKAIEKLFTLVDNNTQDLSIVCEALIWNFRGQAVLTHDHIANFVIHSREENVFTLFAHIIHTDLESACLSLINLSLSGDGIGCQTLSGLLWQFRRLLRILELVQDGITLDNAFKELKITHKKQIELYKHGYKKLHLNDARQILLKFSDQEILLRSGIPKILQKIILESFVTYLCQALGSVHTIK